VWRPHAGGSERTRIPGSHQQSRKVEFHHVPEKSLGARKYQSKNLPDPTTNAVSLEKKKKEEIKERRDLVPYLTIYRVLTCRVRNRKFFAL